LNVKVTAFVKRKIHRIVRAMKVVIIGAGMIGLHIAHELIDERRDVVLVEKDPEAARKASDELDCLVINEDGSRPETLRKAGASDAAWFLALTGSDEVNIVACGLVSAESPTVRTLARVENPFYSSLSEAQRRAFGLHVIINPDAETADAIGRIVEDGFAEDVVPLHGGRLQLRTVEASSVPAFIGKSLKEAKSGAGKGVLVASVVRSRGMIVPDGDFVVESSDILYLLGTPGTLDGFLGQIAGVKTEAKRILVIGATSVGERLVERFLARSKAGFLSRLVGKKRVVTLLDSSSGAAKRIARSHQGVEVIQGDSSEEGVLERAGIERADLVVCATESQAFNVLTAQLAKELGAKKSLAITLNDRYMVLGSSLDVDALVSVKDVVAAAVLETVRRANIRTIHGFYEDDVELVELRVDAASDVSGRSLKEIVLPKGVLVAFVLQADEMLVPTGATVLNGGDVIGLVARKQGIAVLERVFGGQRGL
jgi:trk system potassium uptake protein TrkA